VEVWSRPLPYQGRLCGSHNRPPTRRGRPWRSGLVHGAVGPLSSRTTSRQPVVKIELTVSVHPLSRSSDARPRVASPVRHAHQPSRVNGSNRSRMEGNETRGDRWLKLHKKVLADIRQPDNVDGSPAIRK
jgi:hypothetical protein